MPGLSRNSRIWLPNMSHLSDPRMHGGRGAVVGKEQQLHFRKSDGTVYPA